MTVLDANLLLYAYNSKAPQQPAVSKWLTRLIASNETVGLPWVTIWAFVRISTNARLWEKPRPAQEAFGIISQWLALPGVIALQPGARHFELLQSLVSKHQATGPLVTDSVLAALAMEHGATLASTNQNFSRFEGLRWVNPLHQRTL